MTQILHREERTSSYLHLQFKRYSLRDKERAMHLCVNGWMKWMNAWCNGYEPRETLTTSGPPTSPHWLPQSPGASCSLDPRRTTVGSGIHQSPHCTFAFPWECMEAELHCPVACPIGCLDISLATASPGPPTVLLCLLHTLAHGEFRSVDHFRSATFTSESNTMSQFYLNWKLLEIRGCPRPVSN